MSEGGRSMRKKRTRREFHKSLAALATVSAVGGSAAALAQAAQPPRDPAAASADALFALVQARFGAFLNAEQLEQVRRSIRNRVTAADVLRRVQLKNSDEPAFAFSADA